MNSTLTISSVTLALSFAGCTSTPVNTAFSQADADAAFANTAASYSDPDYAFTADMPESGQATYTGYMTVSDMENVVADGLEISYETFIGELSLTADFTDLSLAGEVTQFSEGSVVVIKGGATSITSGEAAAGTLTLEGGVISGNSFTDLVVSGTLTGSDGADNSLSITTVGAFATVDGSGADIIIGSGDGVVTIPGDEIDSTVYFYGEL